MVILIAFASCIIVIENNYKRAYDDFSETEDSYNQLIKERFGLKIIDTLYSQWVLGLGDFEVRDTIDGAEESDKSILVLTWILFILATLASQVVMMNTLIAILGDTFSKIMERREHHAIKAKTEMYADFMFWLNLEFVSGDKFTK